MTATLERPAQLQTPAETHHARRWLILGTIALAQLMVVLDSTIVNIALPSAQHALGFSDDGRQWIVTAYSLAFGSLLLLGGRLSDHFGRKRMFLIGVAGFAIASAIGGAADGFTMLVAARAAQGAFGALLAPAGLSLLTTTFTDPAERGKAFGIFGAVAGGGAAIGLLLGGALTSYVSWRWCLYVNLAFAAVAFTGGARLLAQHKGVARARIDLPGAAVVGFSLLSLVYGLAHAETAGWASGLTIGAIVVGIVGLMVFVQVERRVAHPLVPLGVVLDRTRGGSYLAMLMSGAGIFAVFLFLTYYLQQTLHWSPVSTGLAFLPMVAALMITATTSTAVLLPRTGPRPLVPTGMVLSSTGMLLLTRIGVDTSYATTVLPALLVLGVGFGLIFAPSMQGATSGVAAADSGVASAMVNTMQQVGGSIGTALLSTLATSAATSYAHSHPGQVAQAMVHSYTTAFTWSAGIFAVGAVVAAVTLRSGRLPAPAEGVLVAAH